MTSFPGDQRLKQLERLYLSGPQLGECLSLETLVDLLLALYDECCNSTLRREKNIAEFVEYGELESFDFILSLRYPDQFTPKSS